MTFARRTAVTSLLFLLLLTGQSSAQRAATAIKVDGRSISQATVLQPESPALESVKRLVMPDDHVAFRVEDWIQGQELFKNFVDPSQFCDSAYPFTLTEINMPLYFHGRTTIIVSVDVEDAIYATEDYPIPGPPLSISADYEFTIDSEGYYDLRVPLDQPVQVAKPFFAGFFIGHIITEGKGVAVLTDADSGAIGRCFSIWDEQVGFVDLLRNRFGNFSGRICLGAAGIPAGERPQTPAPEISFLHPTNNQNLLGGATLWVKETSGSRSIDCVSFEYSSGGEFIEIGRDYDGYSAVRDGVNPAEEGDGFCYLWNIDALPEGTYTVRATAYDLDGRTASDEITVYLDPTPPTPCLISFEDGSEVCKASEIPISCTDENLVRVNLFARKAPFDFSTEMPPRKLEPVDLHQNAAVAAASILQVWCKRDYPASLVSAFSQIPITDMISKLHAAFGLHNDSEATDEAVYSGLTEFCQRTSKALQVEYECRPDYFALRRLIQGEDKAVMIALGGTPGIWLAVDGFSGWRQDDGSFMVAVCDPLDGSIKQIPMRPGESTWLLNYNDRWQPVDRAISVGAAGWDVERDEIGSDSEVADGWQIFWPDEDIPHNSLCFLGTEGIDAGGIRGQSTVLLNCNCSNFFETGDYNDDGRADIIDLTYLIDFMVRNGKPPEGGAERADANGDSRLNIADVVYYSNYLFRSADAPSF